MASCWRSVDDFQLTLPKVTEELVVQQLSKVEGKLASLTAPSLTVTANSMLPLQKRT